MYGGNNSFDTESSDDTAKISELKVFIFFIIFFSVMLTTNLIEKTLLTAIIIIVAFYIFKITHKWFFLTSFALLVSTGVLLALNMSEIAQSIATIAYYLMLTGIVVEIINY